MKRHRMEADNRRKHSANGQVTRRNRSTLPIYTIVPSPDTGRLVVTLRRQGANGSSRMASPDSTVDTMGDVTNISHSRKERGGLAGRHHRLRNDACPYTRQNERSGQQDGEEELKVSLCGESSSSSVVKGQRSSHKVVVKKTLQFSAGSGHGNLDEPKAMPQDLVTDQAQCQDETASSDLNDEEAGTSRSQGAAELKSDGLDKGFGITSTSVEYDATIDDDE